jgi:hypothetical protein
MNLFDVINSSQDLTFINVSITGVVKFPEDASTTRGPWFKAKLVDGQASAKIDCNKDIFTAYANKRVTFSVPAHKDGAKGFYVKRKDYNGKPQFSFGVGVIATLAGEATQDQQAANTHSQQTQAFPVNTGNTPAPQRQQQAESTGKLDAHALAKTWVQLAFVTKQAFKDAGFSLEVQDKAALLAPTWGSNHWFGERHVEVNVPEDEIPF